MQESQETLDRSLGQEDPLEEEMATHSSILAWKIPWTEEPGGVTVHGVAKESDTTEHTARTHASTASCLGSPPTGSHAHPHQVLRVTPDFR